MESLPGDLVLHPLGGKDRTLDEQLTMFHLVMVVVDPYTYESSWILKTANRILTHFSGADCRTGWLVAADEKGARSFLGELAGEMMTFCDPERTFIKALGCNELPAFVHVALDGTVAGMAQGWDPDAWRPIAANLAEMMSWSRPPIPETGDPVPYEGTAAVPA